jgi:hypothetical protein
MSGAAIVDGADRAYGDARMISSSSASDRITTTDRTLYRAPPPSVHSLDNCARLSSP